MALPVVKGKADHLVACLHGQCRSGGGIEAAGEQGDRG